MILTEHEIKNLEKQLIDLRERYAASKITAGSLQKSLNNAIEDERVFKKQFDNVHAIIRSYETEVERINGRHHDIPFSEQDIINHVNEKGRMYNGFNSMSPITIPEMIGQNWSVNKTQPNEVDNFTTINHLINTILNGEGPFSFSPTSLSDDYTSGSGSIKTNGALTPNNWYLIGGHSLLYISSVSYTPASLGTCVGASGSTALECATNGGVWQSNPTQAYWTGTISQRYFLSGFDNNASAGASVSSWSGYSNSERTNKAASSTSQSMMNMFISHLENYLTIWKNLVSQELEIQQRNPEQPQDSLSNVDDISWITEYLLTTPIGNGDPGIDGLQNRITQRQDYFPTRIGINITNHYNSRINLTKMRSDRQSGTLKVVVFISNMKTDFPDNGNNSLMEQIIQIEKMLQKERNL